MIRYDENFQVKYKVSVVMYLQTKTTKYNQAKAILERLS